MSNNIIIFRTISYLNQITGKEYSQTLFANNADMCKLIEAGYNYQYFKFPLIKNIVCTTVISITSII